MIKDNRISVPLKIEEIVLYQRTRIPSYDAKLKHLGLIGLVKKYDFFSKNKELKQVQFLLFLN